MRCIMALHIPMVQREVLVSDNSVQSSRHTGATGVVVVSHQTGDHPQLHTGKSAPLPSHAVEQCPLSS